MENRPTIILIFAVALALFITVGCGYTIVKRTDSAVSEERESIARPWEIDSLCGSWKGAVVMKHNGVPISRDTIYVLRINSDRSYTMDNRDGVLRGTWFFQNASPGFRFVIADREGHEQSFRHFLAYFREWGLQLSHRIALPHMYSIDWELTRE